MSSNALALLSDLISLYYVAICVISLYVPRILVQDGLCAQVAFVGPADCDGCSAQFLIPASEVTLKTVWGVA